MKKLFTCGMLFLLNIGLAYSGGFQINDQSARAVSMGFSTVANPTDASAIFYNPAAITGFDETLNFALGASYIMPGTKFTGITTMNQNDTYEPENWNFLIPHFYAAWKTPVENLSFGLGVFVPFGLGTRWPQDWPGRFLANETYLQAIEINPNLAYSFKLGEIPVSLSAGWGYVMGNVEMKKTLDNFFPEPILTLQGDGTSSTFNFGLQIGITDKLKFGASYRHNIEMDFDGDVSYEHTTGVEALFMPGSGSASINFPSDLRAGISYQLNENLSIEAGINYVGWSSYDTLAITFDKMPGNPTTSYTSAQPRLYEDVIVFRIGAEYFTDNLFLRGGIYYDPMPVQADYVEPTLPEANRLGFSAGFGMKLLDNLNFDLGYLFVYGMQTDVENSPTDFNGYYNAWANVLALTFTYKIQ